MSRKSGVTTKQVDTIRSYTNRGYSANRIQNEMSKQGIGLRRTVMLGYVREFKRQPAKPSVQKYTPRKYAVAKYRRQAPPLFAPKIVILRGRWRGRMKQKTRSGTGRDLYSFVKHEMTEGHWDAKPQVLS